MNREEYFSRLNGVVSDEITRKRVAVIGCGAGSLAIECMARSGVGQFDLVDFDIVEVKNLCRTAFGYDHVGKLKVDCLTELIRFANPFSEVVAWPIDILKANSKTIRQIVRGADILIAGTDSFEAQAFVNTLSVQEQVPAVFVGIHQGATGGRIIWTIPGETPCYRCLSKTRYDARGKDTDLHSENGSLLDGLFIDMVATRIAMAILERGQDSRLGRFFDHMNWRTEVVVRAHRDHQYTNSIRSNIYVSQPDGARDALREIDDIVLCALDTLWLPTERDQECPDCAGRAPISL